MQSVQGNFFLNPSVKPLPQTITITAATTYGQQTQRGQYLIKQESTFKFSKKNNT